MRPQPDTQHGVGTDQQKAANILQGFSIHRLTCRCICDKCAGIDAGCAFVPSTKTSSSVPGKLLKEKAGTVGTGWYPMRCLGAVIRAPAVRDYS
jgi:hypothetical protein